MTEGWFDTHAHVCDPKFDPDRDQIIQKAFANGVRGFVEIADGPSEWEKAEQLSHRYPNQIWWAAGLHPYYSDQSSNNLWNSLKNLTKTPHFVAIGEVGLDYAKCPIPPEKQKEALASAIDLAFETGKPLIVHCREAYADLHPILESRLKNRPKNWSPGVIHCFSGNQADADRLLQLGFYLGVDGPLTYPNSHSLREVFASIPLNRIVIETDSPYLPPQGFRGQRNEPCHIGLIGKKLAEIRNLTESEVVSALYKNSFSLFDLKPIEN